MQIYNQINQIISFFTKIDKENIYIFFFLILGYMISSFINREKNPLNEEEINRKYTKSIEYFNKYQAENEAFFCGRDEDENINAENSDY